MVGDWLFRPLSSFPPRSSDDLEEDSLDESADTIKTRLIDRVRSDGRKMTTVLEKCNEILEDDLTEDFFDEEFLENEESDDDP